MIGVLVEVRTLPTCKIESTFATITQSQFGEVINMDDMNTESALDTCGVLCVASEGVVSRVTLVDVDYLDKYH